jgi:hypothetical protein
MSPHSSMGIGVFFMGLGVGLAGCFASSDEESKPPEKTSCDVETAQLEASFSAQAHGATTQFYAAVFSEGNRSLGCGDSFVVTNGDVRIPLEREPDSGSGPIHYVGAVATPAIATTFTFGLERQAPRQSAPASKVYLPAAFTVLDASTNVKIPSGAIQFRLDPRMPVDATELRPSTVRLRIVVDGPCLDGEQMYLWGPKTLFPPLIKPDGNVVLDTKLFKRKGTEPSCEATLHVTELTTGEIDPAMKGVSGVIDAEGSRHHAELPLHIDW